MGQTGTYTIPIAIPMYNQQEKQIKYQPGFVGKLAHVYCSSNHLPPIQFNRPIRANSIILCQLINSNSGAITNLLSYFTANAIKKVFTNKGEDYFLLKGDVDINPALSCGEYYVMISDGVNVWYSEEFMITENPLNYIKLRYKNDRDLNNVCYQSNFTQEVLIDANIEEPTANNIKKVTEKDGIELQDEQISMEVQRLVFICPKFLYRSLIHLVSHTYVEITEKNGEAVECKNVIMQKPEWVSSNYARIELQFVTNTVVNRYSELNMD